MLIVDVRKGILQEKKNNNQCNEMKLKENE
jgi:hypothetical protein